MLKVTIKGEVYPFDNERYPLPEAIELEEKLGMTFGEWQLALPRGSAKALAGFVWLVLKRSGRDTPLADIVSGAFPLDENDVVIEAEGGDEPGPTGASSDPEGLSTSEFSPSASGSGPGSGTGSP
jgi:hypothetical protein